MAELKKITITENGPYVVTGGVPISRAIIETDAKGESVTWGDGTDFPVSDRVLLCRCGHSSKMPFCDGSHTSVKFNGTETANRAPYMDQADLQEGPSIKLADAKVLCAFARFCDPNGSVWNQVENSDDPAARANLIRQAGDCPSGRLVAIDKVTGKAIEPDLPESIGLIEDPSIGCSGPLWIRGGIELFGSDGVAYEIRNRMTLCRCGRSENKPFCDGSHASDPKFTDDSSQ